MSRPKPRKSSLAGASPVAPPTEATAARQSHTAAAPPATATSRPSTPAKPAKAPAKRRYPPKVSFYQEPEDSARMRAAFLHTQGVEGHRSLSHFIDRAVMAEVERLEAKHNDGRPWPAVQPGGGPTGRPVG